MKKINKIKNYSRKNPLAVVALCIVTAILVYIVIATATAFYKDANGIVCRGLFGVDDSCAHVLYLQLGIFVLNPITICIVLILVIFVIYDFIAAKLRNKKK